MLVKICSKSCDCHSACLVYLRLLARWGLRCLSFLAKAELEGMLGVTMMRIGANSVSNQRVLVLCCQNFFSYFVQ